MPQYSSYFRNNIRRERLTSDTSYTRTVSVNLNQYGTISATDYTANGALFKKVYNDLINRVYDFNVRVYLNVPAGDYYFPGVADVNNYTTLHPPQFGQMVIQGASRVGTRPAATTLGSQNKSQNYTSLANHHQTRFHFNYNGFFIHGTGGNAFYTSSGFSNIGFFGSWGGSPGVQTTDSVLRRCLAGSFRLEYCSIHGFDGNDYESRGITAEGNCSISGYDITVCNCNRAIMAVNGGNINCDQSSTDIIAQYRAEALLAYGNSFIGLGDRTQMRSTRSIGAYGVYAVGSSAIRIRNYSISGGAGVYARPDGSTIHSSTSY